MNSSKIALSINHDQNNLGDGYLKFQLNRQTSALLSMRHTQEAIIIPFEAVTSMPNMPPCILGLMNWRSRIIWAIDLPRMLNLEYLDNRLRQHNVIVIRVESMLVGLVVQEIKGTAKFMPDDIRSPLGHIASSLVPYLRGCVIQEKEIMLVLDAQAIVQSSILRTD
ncbi:chemotaxis protein CheW [Aetokthonos hydrillicola Thurmond2011]|jgi:twitching motility protein PilI|uniref:Chemotaxis protein CheW n=1 Tax=Aetokthonos hydrillicola Thurmond2011 TaxID=2712845 RepID=A0AAP5IC16_9CYAN|nr:chemotaxis protein CheW [Aetokthonos hydrillicola]MBO3457371.1 purine-binding chemotaxis protein CheW [Aetokthonos hydrillicola CCALA 1050]MBW4583952.1 chemotaxis protein CheW [Aetokthonos hydrillicola CCALA 1050]MDR9898852.1 chemotaxis protein CheW [Aetokthonos hydrillicola Thurmond2011]